MNSQSLQKESRLHIRASASQKALLAQAAQVRHLNVSQFVLQVCLEAAEKTVREREGDNKIRVSAEEYDWLLQKLEESLQENEGLRRLLGEASVWNG